MKDGDPEPQRRPASQARRQRGERGGRTGTARGHAPQGRAPADPSRGAAAPGGDATEGKAGNEKSVSGQTVPRSEDEIKTF